MSVATVSSTVSDDDDDRSYSRRLEFGFFMPRSAAKTLNGFRRWYLSRRSPKHCKVSFLGDEVYFEMSPERVDSHVSLKYEIGNSLINHARETRSGYAFGDGVTVTNKEAKLSSEPDAMFIRRETIRSGAVRLRKDKDGFDTVEVIGSPDLVVEVLSPSSIQKDRKRLMTRYADAGVLEYWILDARRGELHFHMHHASPEGFVEVSSSDDWLPSAVLGLDVRLMRYEDDEIQFSWYRMELGRPQS